MAYKNFKATEIIEEIGAELRKIRTDKNQTISRVALELAKNGLHISNTLLGRIENGERRIDDNTLNDICNYYQVDPSSVIIAASKEHIRRFSETPNDNSASSAPVGTEHVYALYHNLNAEGQKEVAIDIDHCVRFFIFSRNIYTYLHAPAPFLFL